MIFLFWWQDGGKAEDSLTSTEFDRFLAERAAAADNLPTISKPNVQATTATTAPPAQSSAANKSEDNLLL